jgi:hypothetical protein
MNMPKVTGIELTEQEARDILTTAIEGRGIQYWASDYGVIYIERDPETLDITQAKITADNSKDEKKTYVVDTDLIKWAVIEIAKSGTWGELIGDIVNEDVDADGADTIVQYACFGEVIYG